MATIDVTAHLHARFPVLARQGLEVEASTVAEVIDQLEAMAPGFAFYVCDERGRLRRHVNIFVGEEMIVDRRRLSDPVGPDTRVFIVQALSGG